MGATNARPRVSRAGVSKEAKLKGREAARVHFKQDHPAFICRRFPVLFRSGSLYPDGLSMAGIARQGKPGLMKRVCAFPVF